MPIRSVDDPASARAIARATFAADPAGGGARFEALLPMAAEVGAVALFNLPLESLMQGRFDDAIATGWRYVRLQPGAELGEVVEVRTDDENIAEFSKYATGRLAGRMSEVGGAAADLLADATDEYEARILRLPEIHMEALWLHAEDEAVQDHFFGLPSTQKDLIDGDFIDTAIKRARVYLSHGGNQNPTGTPAGAGL